MTTLRRTVLGVLLLTAVAATARAADETPRTRMGVHEWGTFTVLQAEDGRAIPGINTDDEPVPHFVHDLHGMLVGGPSQVPTVYFKGAPRVHPDVIVRLETPVIYFHPPAGAKGPIERGRRRRLQRRVAHPVLPRRQGTRPRHGEQPPRLRRAGRQDRRHPRVAQPQSRRRRPRPHDDQPRLARPAPGEGGLGHDGHVLRPRDRALPLLPRRRPHQRPAPRRPRRQVGGCRSTANSTPR